MRKVEDYVEIVTVFPLIFASIDCVPRCADNPGLTTVHTLYSDIVNELLHNNFLLDKMVFAEAALNKKY